MSYGPILKTMLIKIIIAIALMLFVGYIGFNLGFHGIDSDMLSIIICYVAPIAAIVFAVSDAKALLRKARESGGVFDGMSDYMTVAILLFINLVVVLIAINTLFPAVFESNISYGDYNYPLITGCIGIVWYGFELFLFSRR